MSRPSAPNVCSVDCEPRSATNWRAVAAAGLVGLLALTSVAVFMIVGPSLGKQPQVERSSLMARPSRTNERWAPPPVHLTSAPLPPQAAVWESVLAPRPVPHEAQQPTVVASARPVPERVPAPTLVIAEPLSGPEPQSRAPTMRFRQLQSLPEHLLAEQLQRLSTEVSLDTVKDTSKKLYNQGKDSSSKVKTAPIAELLEQRKDLAGLPLQAEADCQLATADGKSMQLLSTRIRGNLAPLRRDRRPTPDYDDPDLAAASLQSTSFSDKEWRQKEVVPTLAQTLQAQGLPLRLVLVRLLAEQEGPAASAALARRAIFDLSPDIRETAVQALRKRPAAEYRQVFLDGLRYPVNAMAEHAAEALAALQDREAAPALVKLLDLPDPSAPVSGKDGRLRMPELVRINHLANCLLCHAPSHDRQDLVRGLIPTPGEPLPVVYYESRSGNFVRADITYFRQDFSLVHRVAEPNKWPPEQRFDYLIRTRTLSQEEAASWRFAQVTAVPQEAPPSYPQREAVLFTLRAVVNREAGPRSEDWKRVLVEERLSQQ